MRGETFPLDEFTWHGTSKGRLRAANMCSCVGQEGFNSAVTCVDSVLAAWLRIYEVTDDLESTVLAWSHGTEDRKMLATILLVLDRWRSLLCTVCFGLRS